MLKWAFFSRQGRVLNFFCSILPSTCPFNKLIHTKNVAEKNKRVGRKQKNFIWTPSATFSSMNTSLLGQHKAEDKQQRSGTFQVHLAAGKRPDTITTLSHPHLSFCGSSIYCLSFTPCFDKMNPTYWGDKYFNIEVSESAEKKKSLVSYSLISLLHFREGARAPPKTFLLASRSP